MRRAANIPVGIAGSKEKFTAFAPEAAFRSLLRKSTSDAVGGELDISRNISALRKQGVDIPLRAAGMGRYSLSVAHFGVERSRKQQGTMVSAPHFEWFSTKKRPDLADGGLRVPY